MGHVACIVRESKLRLCECGATSCVRSRPSELCIRFLADTFLDTETCGSPLISLLRVCLDKMDSEEDYRQSLSDRLLHIRQILVSAVCVFCPLCFFSLTLISIVAQWHRLVHMMIYFVQY